MSSSVPRFVQKYGKPLGKKGIAKLEAKISHNIILNKYKEYLQFNNVMYLFQWQINEDISYLNKNTIWETFSNKLVGRHHYSRDLASGKSTGLNITPLEPSIYKEIMTEALLNKHNPKWIQSEVNNNDVRCIFQEFKPQRISDVTDYLNKISKSLSIQGQREDIYNLNLSHLCIKISGLNGMDLGEPITSNQITNEPLDYEGLLKMATQSKIDPPFKKLLQSLIKYYGISKPSFAHCDFGKDKDRWLVISH